MNVKVFHHLAIQVDVAERRNPLKGLLDVLCIRLKLLCTNTQIKLLELRLWVAGRDVFALLDELRLCQSHLAVDSWVVIQCVQHDQ